LYLRFAHLQNANKIKSAEEISQLIGVCPRQRKVIMCHGTFDVVHPGHINHFLFCKTKCDFLVVSVTSDKFVMKGPHRPIFTLQKRMEFLNSIKFIDLIIPSNYLNATYNIDLIKT
jgi:cytidyltransferase-like protein